MYVLKKDFVVFNMKQNVQKFFQSLALFLTGMERIYIEKIFLSLVSICQKTEYNLKQISNVIEEAKLHFPKSNLITYYRDLFLSKIKFYKYHFIKTCIMNENLFPVLKRFVK